MNLTIGYSDSRQNYRAQTFEAIEDQQQALTGTAFSNRATYQLQDHFIGLLYRNKIGKLTWAPELSLHRYTLSNEQLSRTDAQQQWIWLPAFTAKYALNDIVYP